MRTPGHQTYLFTSVLVAMTIGCNRQNQQATRDPTPLNVPEPMPEGPYSDPAATSPGSREARADESADSAQNNLNQGYFHCPPPGTTPPSDNNVEQNGRMDPIDCPPGDPNSSTSIIGIPGAEKQE
ncbi:hypothetical protein [Oligoflexus tunisiensis]|uniref:hypothetical protein n=1 Tax=Oligoflexus tunisiensis TaxID=708132 RepID=UPI00114D0DFF|nr:hypothetical protein [Oligoflexus tunisiensis]